MWIGLRDDPDSRAVTEEVSGQEPNFLKEVGSFALTIQHPPFAGAWRAKYVIGLSVPIALSAPGVEYCVRPTVAKRTDGSGARGDSADVTRRIDNLLETADNDEQPDKPREVGDCQDTY